MHNNFVYVITWYLSFTVRKTGAASWSSPKWLASRIGPPNSQCSGAAPGKVMNLKFSGNVPNLVLGKVRKFQHRSFSGFGDIPEKPEGWMKTTPLPPIGLRLDIVLSTIRQLITHSRTSYGRNTIMTFAYCHKCAAFAIVARRLFAGEPTTVVIHI